MLLIPNEEIITIAERQIPVVEATSPEEYEKVLQMLELPQESKTGVPLNIDEFCRLGLGPHFKTKIGDIEVYMSKTFETVRKEAILIYIMTAHGLQVNPYYQSGSQASWRLLPDYELYMEFMVSHLGKGFGEASISAPYSVQFAIGEVQRLGGINYSLGNFAPYFLALSDLEGEESSLYYRTTNTEYLNYIKVLKRKVQKPHQRICSLRLNKCPTFRT